MAKRIDRRRSLVLLGGFLGSVPAVGGTARSTNQGQAEAEPNDSRSEATRIGPGRVFGHIGPCCLPGVGDDEDWFAFDVDSGDGILVDFQQRPVSAAALVGPDGTVLDRDGPSATRLAGTAGQSGTAYVRLMDPPGGANGDYAFTLSIDGVGDSDGGGTPDDSDGDGSGSDGVAGSTFEVQPTDDGSEFSYRFTVDGAASKTEAGDIHADDEDQIVPCDDGTTTVVGYTGDGQGDAYAIEGDLVSFRRTSGSEDFRLVLDGEDVTGLLTSATSMFEVESTEEGTEFSYRFGVEGDVSKTVYRGRAADYDDHVVACSDGSSTVVGSTGDGAADTYAIDGQITRFERTSGSTEYRLLLDGQDVTGRLTS